MGIFDRIRRIVRAEATAVRDKASDAWEGLEIPTPRRATAPPPSSGDAPGAGVSPGPAKADPIRKAYARLEVPVGSDLATVKKAYRAGMRRYHPDRHGDDPDKSRAANTVAAGLTDAYDTLVEHLGSS